MQLTRLVAVLIAAALPAIASAAECSEANYEKAPDSLVAEFDKIADALDKAVTEAANALEARDLRLLERQESDTFVTRQFQCTGNEKCIGFESTVMCYDEKSSLLRSPEEITINPKNGDMVLPDKTKANAFTNIQPVLDYMKKLNGVEVEEGDSPAAATKYADVGANPSATAPAAKPSGSDEAKSPAGKIAVGGWMMASAAALAAAAVVIV